MSELVVQIGTVVAILSVVIITVIWCIHNARMEREEIEFPRYLSPEESAEFHRNIQIK